MSDPDEAIVVYEAANITEAHFVKNLLVNEGINAMVSEENAPLSLPITPTDVLVRRADEARARAFILEYDAEQIKHTTGPTGSARPAAWTWAAARRMRRVWHRTASGNGRGRIGGDCPNAGL